MLVSSLNASAPWPAFDFRRSVTRLTGGGNGGHLNAPPSPAGLRLALRSPRQGAFIRKGNGGTIHL